MRLLMRLFVDFSAVAFWLTRLGVPVFLSQKLICVCYYYAISTILNLVNQNATTKKSTKRRIKSRIESRIKSSIEFYAAVEVI